MSILDKLPEAPEGYEWVSTIYATESDTNVYLRLESAYLPGRPPRVPESTHATYEFCPPDEDSLISAAGRILERFEESAEKQERIDTLQVEASKRYAHLVISRPKAV
jgi:hypothetical protein